MGGVKRTGVGSDTDPAQSKRLRSKDAAIVASSKTIDVYRKRLLEQGKYEDTKPGSRSCDSCLHDPPALPPLNVEVFKKRAPLPRRASDGSFEFTDFPNFKPNLSPQEVLQRGSFGGTYFRDITSAVTGRSYKGLEVIKEFPEPWFEGVDLGTQVVSGTYSKHVNRFKVACGGSLGMWETSGWIAEIDPYGWFQWYCRFFLGRRSADDRRQVDRWMKGQGPKGRFRLQLLNKIIAAKANIDDVKVSPVLRQVAQHWAYEASASDLAAHRKGQ
mmetsp:Transcript_4884/g.9545  ORF Transcript_4884/g.9545 Transcript_4884/m.9545 type:complete len:272 (-) Transcript_4884:193-1008(-)|eukprot:CAMPEP_0172694704 /NCGR_PEP_ID=MMETSP1074-20121228/26845_1 /TAXON_ID=2916 /ORGANISM="Ceratium fusus, Strain PA161109" /LENGTH=271 /DNA_ID=CAMNT_0013515223 /DNA_START=41 /DNA_END=856 /DNA_ORIENTATION=-